MVKTPPLLRRPAGAVACLALGLTLAMATAQAQELSGSASGGGAIEGGSGAPGGGVGIPGAIASGTTATGISLDDTLGPDPVPARIAGAGPDASQARAYYPIAKLKGHHHPARLDRVRP